MKIDADENRRHCLGDSRRKSHAFANAHSRSTVAGEGRRLKGVPWTFALRMAARDASQLVIHEASPSMARQGKRGWFRPVATRKTNKKRM